MSLYIIELINPAKSPITPPPSAISVSLLSIPLSRSSAIVFSRISKLLLLSPVKAVKVLKFLKKQ